MPKDIRAVIDVERQKLQRGPAPRAFEGRKDIRAVQEDFLISARDNDGLDNARWINRRTFGQCGLNPLHHLGQPKRKLFPARGQRHTARTSHNKLITKDFPHLLEGVADSGLAESQPVCRPRDTAFLSHRLENPKKVQVDIVDIHGANIAYSRGAVKGGVSFG